MSRYFWRLVFSLFIVIVGALFVLFLVLNASLPQLDGEIAAARISADVAIERDASGIATVIADNRIDLAFGTGFAHGQDRFFQMDLARRQAAGELSEIIGATALELDKRNRIHRFRKRAEDAISQMTDDDDEIVMAYVDGVNAGLGSLGAKPFEYFLLGVSPEPWHPVDTLLVAYSMFLVLHDEDASRDIKRGLVHRVVPLQVFDWLYPDGTKWDAPIAGEIREDAPIPSADILDVGGSMLFPERLPSDEEGDRPFFGSNNWAVSGKLTSSGRAIVANDMHLGLQVPNVFYRLRLIERGDDRRGVNGVSLPGTPVMVAGSNGRVAWGFTNSYGDWSDAVVLREGTRPDTYLTPDGEMPVKTRKELIGIKGEAPYELVVRETIWGPILEEHDYPVADVAVRWLAHMPEAVNLRQLELEKVKNVFEAVRVANRMGMPPQNFVTGDADGNIAWTIAGQIPIREGYDAGLPADWSEIGGWRGWLDPDAYPQIINPESGRIWTANARVVDGDALNKIGDGGYDLGARARQIRNDLFARGVFEPSDMIQIQTDDRAEFLTPWRDLLLTVLDAGTVPDHPMRDEYRKLADEWIPRASVDSVGYRLVRAFRNQVRQIVFNALLLPVTDVYGEGVEFRMSNQFEGPLWTILKERPAHLLPADYASWDALLLDAVDRNIEYFFENFDGELAQRSWGERNTAAIRHPLSDALPVFGAWLAMPRDPLSGDSNMPKAQGRNWGASERFAVSPGDEANGYLHMPGGQSGHPLSEFFGVGHQYWVDGQPTRFLPGPAQHLLILKPSQ
jgi:penicillin amidase